MLNKILTNRLLKWLLPLTLVVLLVPHLGALAATTPEINIEQKDFDAVMLAQQVLHTILWPVMAMIGSLLDNSALFGNGMEDRIREVWIPIRNVVNILFVVALVGIALYNVLGLGDDNGSYTVKAILPKIIVGIIAVNFSFLGIKVFLDFINVLTVSVFALPNEINISVNQDDEIRAQQICKQFSEESFSSDALPEEIEANNTISKYKEYGQSAINDPNIWNAIAWEDGDNPDAVKAKITTAIGTIKDANKKSAAETQFNKNIEDWNTNKLCAVEGDKYTLTEKGKAFFGKWRSSNAAMLLAINLGKIAEYTKVDFATAKNIPSAFIAGLFGVLMYIVYAASFVALLIVLLARLVIMWLALVLSPVLILTLAVPTLKEQMGAFKEISDQFVKNAIAPLTIALSLTIGWIMLSSLQSAQINISSDDLAGLALRIPISGLNTLQELTVAIGTLAVVWMGVFSAASNTIAAAVTDQIKNGLQAAGKWVGALPFRHAPIIPIKNAQGVSRYGVGDILKGFSDKFYQLNNKPSKFGVEQLGLSGGAGTLADLSNPNIVQTSQQVVEKLVEPSAQTIGKLKGNEPKKWEEVKLSLQNFQKNNRGAWSNLQNENPILAQKIEAFIKNQNAQTASALAAEIEAAQRQLPATSTTAAQTSSTPPVTTNTQTVKDKTTAIKGTFISKGKVEDIKNTQTATAQVAADVAALKAQGITTAEELKTKGGYTDADYETLMKEIGDKSFDIQGQTGKSDPEKVQEGIKVFNELLQIQ